MGTRIGVLLAAVLILSVAAPASAQIEVAPPGPATIDIAGEPFLGPATAPVTIVEFCDYRCGYCSQLSRSLRELTRRYPTQVKVVFKDFPLDSHPGSGRAAEAASCAGAQGRYWQMHDVLYSSGIASDISDDGLRGMARRVGLDVDGFMRCVNSGRFEAEWRADRAEGQRAGVTGTPTLFVNGSLYEGLAGDEELAGMVEGALGNR